MSDLPDMSDRDGLAAEYVLGTLPLPERLAAERLVMSDADFARLVEDWQTRLQPLNDAYAEMPPPPGLLPKIEARLFPVAPKAARWRLPFFGTVAAALAAVALIAYWPAPKPDLITATLTGENQPLVVQASYDPQVGQATFTRKDGPAAAAGKDYELWVIPAGQSAISLGLLRDGDLTVALDGLPPGTTLAVTLEQTGGSPTGAAQGPILAVAVIDG